MKNKIFSNLSVEKNKELWLQELSPKKLIYFY
jgi:hypothetical protein